MARTLGIAMGSKKWPFGWCGRLGGVAVWVVTTNLARGSLAWSKKSGSVGGCHE
jgi:hypothetical protein